MKVKLDKELESLDGDHLSYRGKDGTVRNICLIVLLQSSQKQFEQKVKIAKKIRESDDEVIDLKAEEVMIIKKGANELMDMTSVLRYAFEEAIDHVEDTAKEQIMEDSIDRSDNS